MNFKLKNCDNKKLTCVWACGTKVGGAARTGTTGSLMRVACVAAGFQFSADWWNSGVAYGV